MSKVSLLYRNLNVEKREKEADVDFQTLAKTSSWYPTPAITGDKMG
jgi:hypothetical protein